MGVLGIVGNAARNNEVKNWGRYDVKRKNNWVMTFNRLFAPENFLHSLTIALYKSARPTFSFGEATLHRGNERWFVATRPEPQDLSVGFYDALPMTGINYDFQRGGGSPHPDYNPGQVSAAQALYNWLLLLYNPAHGNIGLASEYKTDAYVTLYASLKTPIERWMYVGIFPKSITLGDLDYSAEGDPLTIDGTFRYDKVYRISPESWVQPSDATGQLKPETNFFTNLS